MSRIKYFQSLLCFLVLIQAANPQKTKYILPEPVKTELNRLDEAYQILDQFSKSVWDSWDDYITYPFLFIFQNGLRVLVGHPAPPSIFVPYPDFTVHRLKVYIDTTKLNNFVIKQPFQCGGGPLSLGTYNNKPVTTVNIWCTSSASSQLPQDSTSNGENNILVFIHELMHCTQPKILKFQYGNLRINPDLNIALFADIEGQALVKAYEQTVYETSIPFLKDFCIARSLKVKDLSRSEKNSSACDEFREGEAVYSEITILQNIRNGFNSSLSIKNDTAYKRFWNPEVYLAKYMKNLKKASGNTLDIYEKNYWFGCFESLLLQRYFPEWQKEIESGKWLDQILFERLNITAADSLNALQRFQDIYHLDSLKAKHGTIISERNDTYNALQRREGKAYIIDFKPISQSLISLVDKSKKKYQLGLINMYPDGLGEISFDKISMSFSPVLSEINQLYYVKLIDINSDKNKNPFKIKYESKDEYGFYYNITITTPLFILKAPKITIIESTNRIKFVIHSRV